ncbi:hypothetical protein [Mesorhizobium caraganae]|uniref:hypothetical protein n=1 Tax=Mesorhizobium caraganae TaxID=483206 RepID=UPI00177F22FB|nr:hypothetical protein [Mesorhizobium caraganae]
MVTAADPRQAIRRSHKGIDFIAIEELDRCRTYRLPGKPLSERDCLADPEAGNGNRPEQAGYVSDRPLIDGSV